MESELLSLLNTICPTAQVGTGNDTKAPFILYSYSDQVINYKIGYRADITLFVIDWSEDKANEKIASIKSLFSNRQAWHSVIIRKIEWNLKNSINLPDGRYLKELNLVVIYEEV
jgi:hypothetical protein